MRLHLAWTLQGQQKTEAHRDALPVHQRCIYMIDRSGQQAYQRRRELLQAPEVHGGAGWAPPSKVTLDAALYRIRICGVTLRWLICSCGGRKAEYSVPLAQQGDKGDGADVAAGTCGCITPIRPLSCQHGDHQHSIQLFTSKPKDHLSNMPDLALSKCTSGSGYAALQGMKRGNGQGLCQGILLTDMQRHFMIDVQCSRGESSPVCHDVGEEGPHAPPPNARTQHSQKRHTRGPLQSSTPPAPQSCCRSQPVTI